MTGTPTAPNPEASPLVVVLVEPHHPGNIGSVARAMSNMGVSELRLVNPCEETSETRALAWNATSILDRASHHPSLRDALTDCVHTLGFSARSGRMRVAPRSLPEAARRLDDLEGRTALVFGREDSGLTIEEYELCQDLVRIPTAAENTSLNLAQAVMVALYEIRGRRAARQRETGGSSSPPLTNHLLGHQAPTRFPVPSPREARVESRTFERLMSEWDAMVRAVGYGEFGPKDLLGRVTRRLRRIFHRARLSNEDADMLLGISRRVQGKNRVPGAKQPNPGPPDEIGG